MHVANVKLSHCEAKFCRVWAKFGRVRRKTAPTGPGGPVNVNVRCGLSTFRRDDRFQFLGFGRLRVA